MTFDPPFFASENNVKNDLNPQKDGGPDSQVPPTALIQRPFEDEPGGTKPGPYDHADKKQGRDIFS